MWDSRKKYQRDKGQRDKVLENLLFVKYVEQNPDLFTINLYICPAKKQTGVVLYSSVEISAQLTVEKDVCNDRCAYIWSLALPPPWALETGCPIWKAVFESQGELGRASEAIRRLWQKPLSGDRSARQGLSALVGTWKVSSAKSWRRQSVGVFLACHTASRIRKGWQSTRGVAAPVSPLLRPRF